MRRVLLLLLAIAGHCGCAQAQVFEIDAGGAMRRIDPDATATSPASDEANPIAGDVIGPEVPAAYHDAVQSAAQRYALSPWLLDAVARSESGYRADAVSGAGAIGIMQLMPGTARELDVDPADPTQNILGGAAYLRRMLDAFDGNLDLALAAYNAGSGSVQRHGGVPPFRETRDYVQRNLDRLAFAAVPDVDPATGQATSLSSQTGGLP